MVSFTEAAYLTKLLKLLSHRRLESHPVSNGAEIDLQKRNIFAEHVGLLSALRKWPCGSVCPVKNIFSQIKL